METSFLDRCIYNFCIKICHLKEFDTPTSKKSFGRRTKLLHCLRFYFMNEIVGLLLLNSTLKSYKECRYVFKFMRMTMTFLRLQMQCSESEKYLDRFVGRSHSLKAQRKKKLLVFIVATFCREKHQASLAFFLKDDRFQEKLCLFLEGFVMIFYQTGLS